MDEKQNDFFADTYKLLTTYIDDRLLLLKIQTAEKTGKLISSLLTLIISLLLVFFMLFFISMMGGYYFAELTGSQFYGFAIIVGIYFIVLIGFILLSKKYLSKIILNKVIRVLFEKSNSDIYENDN